MRKTSTTWYLQLIHGWLVLTLVCVLVVLVLTFDRAFLWWALGLLTAMFGFFGWEFKRRLAGKEVGSRFAVAFNLLFVALSLWVILGLLLAFSNMYAVTGFDFDKIWAYSFGEAAHGASAAGAAGDAVGVSNVGSLENLPAALPTDMPAQVATAAPQPMTKVGMGQTLVDYGWSQMGVSDWLLTVAYTLVSLGAFVAWRPARRRIFAQGMTFARQEEEERLSKELGADDAESASEDSSSTDDQKNDK